MGYKLSWSFLKEENKLLEEYATMVAGYFTENICFIQELNKDAILTSTEQSDQFT